jgi:hypothetical protein
LEEQMDVEEFDGCKRACRTAGRHTLVWGDCSAAPESARPEPKLTVMRTRIAEDGYPSLVGELFTRTELAERIELTLRAVPLVSAPPADADYQAMALAAADDLIEADR